jgi:hypothetical protein
MLSIFGSRRRRRRRRRRCHDLRVGHLVYKDEPRRLDRSKFPLFTSLVPPLVQVAIRLLSIGNCSASNAKSSFSSVSISSNDANTVRPPRRESRSESLCA